MGREWCGIPCRGTCVLFCCHTPQGQWVGSGVRYHVGALSLIFLSHASGVMGRKWCGVRYHVGDLQSFFLVTPQGQWVGSGVVWNTM